jgi:hypothetical protein
MRYAAAFRANRAQNAPFTHFRRHIGPAGFILHPVEPWNRPAVLQVKANTETSRSEEVDMTRRDQELLDRQLRGLCIQPPPTGTMILAIMAVFVAGLFLGNLRSEAREPVHFDTVEMALSAPSGLNPAQTVLR